MELQWPVLQWNCEALRNRRSGPARWPRPAMAGATHDHHGHSHRRKYSASLWSRRISFAAEQSILVSGFRKCDGDGLAFLRDYNLRDGRAEARAESKSSRAWPVCLWRTSAKASRSTPDELHRIADARGLNGDELVRISRLTAKIDNNCIADGFQIYLHSFVLTAKGQWGCRTAGNET